MALSFVQRPEDIDEVRALTGGRARIMAKLEKPSAIDHLDAIIERADAVMVARGDLGVEMPAELVPTIQRQILRAARAAGKPVVVATQMLESMTETPTPTRAEASDVATAVYGGADAVMLSAESASGKHPVAAVQIMDRIIAAVEADPTYRQALDAANPAPQATIADTICHALQQAAAVLPVKALGTCTVSRANSMRTARTRPAAPIFALAPDVAVARQLAQLWSTYPIVTEPAKGVTQGRHGLRHRRRPRRRYPHQARGTSITEFFATHFAFLTTPEGWAAMVTLIAMVVVLGIDNLIFISILTNKLPREHRERARKLGIGAALIMRLILLATIAYVVGMTTPVFSAFGHDFSWRDLILIAAALPLRRRSLGARPAGADDEHYQRRGSWRQPHRYLGIHDHDDRRREAVPRGPESASRSSTP